MTRLSQFNKDNIFLKNFNFIFILTPELQQLLKFILVAVFRTLLDILIWHFLVLSIKDRKKILQFFDKYKLNEFAIAQVFAFVVSVIISYYINKIFVFETKDNNQELATLLKFFGISLVSFFASTWIINFLTSNSKMLKFSKISPLLEKNWPLVAKILTIGVTLLINYFGYYFLVF